MMPMQFIFILMSLVSVHDFHLSKSEVRVNYETRTVQVATKIFIDDFEEAMAKEGIADISLTSEKIDPNLIENYIQSYIFKHFTVINDDEPIPFLFIGKEFSEDIVSIWCYFESDPIENIGELKISNRVLFDLFEDQKNIMVVQEGEEKNHYMLDPTDFEITLSEAN